MHIGEMLARNGRRFPNDVALVEQNPAENKRTEITWQEFDRRAARFSDFLRQRGIGKGDRVVHLLHNSIDWLIAYFGIIRTGAWVVPLNFRFTTEDIRYCTTVAEPKAVLFGEEFSERLDPLWRSIKTAETFIAAGEVIPTYAVSFAEALQSGSPDPIPVDIGPEDPCGLYFTSGTTGRPKPILLTHQNLACAAITEKIHHDQIKDDNFVIIPPLYHTGAMMHWLGSLIVGGRAVILKGVTPRWILETMSREQGTILWLLVPWALDILVELDSGKLKLSAYDLSSWRLMHMGAMPIPPDLIRRWKTYFPEMQYDTTYGLSEATGPNCFHLGIENTHKVGAIGRAGFNWEMRIVDDYGKEVASGEVGELTVRGGGVMKEYYRNPEATAQTLRDGWLFTGDMARQDEDGFVYLVDRKKDVIICGGENVFPVEVENHLHTHPQVKDAAVIGYPDERLGEIVAAVIEVIPGGRLSEEEVRTFCETLPRYKRPRKVFFSEIPRNPTGKILKTTLRARYIGDLNAE
ncbi:MAG: acyl--CoA ligase [Deltaproteobacteria bacterium]|nr:acyl--CoA ligase [Deltaproteobacteria bacterium]